MAEPIKPEDTELAKTIAAEAPRGKTVTMSEAQFKALMDRIDRVEGGFKKPARVKDHVAYLRVYNSKPIVKYGQAKVVYDKELRKNRMDLELYTAEDQTKPFVVDYLTFLNEDNQVKVSILSQKAVESIESMGTRAKVDPKTDRFMDSEIELEVRSVVYQAEIEITEGELKGQKLSVPADALNR